MGLHDDHRKRLDAKIREKGIDALEVHEQLEYVLFAAIPRGDTNEIAHGLLEKFDTIEGVFRADIKELMEVKGVGYRTAMFLSTMMQVVGIADRHIEQDKKKVLDDSEKIQEFVKTYFYKKIDEAFYLLSLSPRKRLLAISKISEGDEGEVPIYVKKLAKKAVINDARYVVLVHNHPCGNVSPSISDVKMSNELVKVFDAIGVEVLDSIIVSGKQCCSLKDGGYLTKMLKK